MEFINLVKSRFSCRGYSKKPVETEKIDYILECTRLAPSAANKQPWKIYIVKNPDKKKQLVQAYKKKWMEEAPLITVFTGIMGENWVRKDGLDYLMCDITIVTDYFILAATHKGLGTCYVAAFDEKIVKESLNLPPNEKPFLMTPLGYPLEGSTRERKRKDLAEIVRII